MVFHITTNKNIRSSEEYQPYLQNLYVITCITYLFIINMVINNIVFPSCLKPSPNPHTCRLQRQRPPPNVNSFPFDGWMTTTRPTKCVVTGQIGKILRFEDYYFQSEPVLCTRAFSVATVSTNS